MEKRLYRSQSDRMIWGVCGGMANYLNVDPTVVRLIAVLLLFLGGSVILAYIVFAIVMPLELSKAAISQEVPKTDMTVPKESGKGSDVTVGIVLIVVGILFLAGVLNLFWWFRWGAFWAFVLVAIGVFIVLAARRH